MYVIFFILFLGLFLCVGDDDCDDDGDVMNCLFASGVNLGK